MNLLIVAPHADALAQRMAVQYHDVMPTAVPRYEQVLPFVRSGLCHAVVLDDRMGSIDALCAAVDAGIHAGLPVLVHGVGPARARMIDLQDRGAQVTDGLDEDALMRWIAARLALVRVETSTTRLVATASAKGGAGKTTVLVVLAEAFAACGLKVLLVENDLSNAALRQVYGCGPDIPSYIELTAIGDTRGITPTSLRQYCHRVTLPVRDRTVTLDLLLGPVSAASQLDLTTHHTDALFQSVQQMGYDVVFVDTGPEIMRRPTAFFVLQAGGKVIVPCPTGVLEREGAVNLLTTVGERMPQAVERCGLIFLEPERGSISAKDLPQIRRNATTHFASVTQIGIMPRDAHALSLSAATRLETGRYASVLHVVPHSRMARTVWQLAETVASWLDLTLPQRPPASSWVDRLFRRTRVVALPPMAPETESVVVPEPSAPALHARHQQHPDPWSSHDADRTTMPTEPRGDHESAVLVAVDERMAQ